ncbi:MAG: radical SAM family heme chaperone HemW [Heliobacteriaceae bacterium]|jgi:oxygen-independent coproporphyrinogen-3 oxidase|nr:radical SAM family heme chaperone HemW [Heliobacteriaceae bacterium]
MPENAYIHIPFCRSKCRYCSFVSSVDLSLKKDYLKALKKEIKFYYKGEPLQTLYFGGGTPSVSDAGEIEELISLFNINSGTEITVEMNPESFKNIRGANRISFGCQTFDDNILQILGRRHSANDVKNSVKAAQDCGFDNISLDFIYGLPSQTVQGFEKDLEKAVSLGVRHISLYGLKIEQNCYFHLHPPKNLPDEDIQADMYLKAIEVLTSDRFKQYEISNFAHSGFESAHNLNCWNNGKYYGFGAAAHGYKDNIRYSNTSDINEYIKEPVKHSGETVLTAQEQLEEEIFLGLRKTDGINIQSINKKFGINFERKYSGILSKYSEYIVPTAHGYRLTINGVLVSSAILSEFISV